MYKKGVPRFNFADASDTAGWKCTCISHEAYIASTILVSPWIKVPGWRLETAWGDLVHDIHLGIGRDAVASGLVYLVENNILKTAEGLSSKDLQGI